jgi:hypothetical protein
MQMLNNNSGSSGNNNNSCDGQGRGSESEMSDSNSGTIAAKSVAARNETANKALALMVQPSIDYGE